MTCDKDFAAICMQCNCYKLGHEPICKKFLHVKVKALKNWPPMTFHVGSMIND